MNSIVQFLFELVSRLKTESPPWFKKLQWISGIATLFLGIIKSLLLFGIWHPAYSEALGSFLTASLAAIVAIFGTSFTPIKDSANRLADGPGTDPSKPHGQKPA